LHLEDLLVGFIGIVTSWGIDKDDLITVFFVTEDPIREDWLGALSIMGIEHDPLCQSCKSKSKITPPHAPPPYLNIHLHQLPPPKSTRTRLRRGVGTAIGGVFYTLNAVYVAWLIRDAPGEEYMKEAREHGLAVSFVSVTERKHVVDWLEGKVQESDRIAPLACAYHSFFLLVCDVSCC
jgi:hypothetical protein